MSNMVMFTDIMDNNDNLIGQVKQDLLRKSRQWTALGFNGMRLADVETYEEAIDLIHAQDLDKCGSRI